MKCGLGNDLSALLELDNPFIINVLNQFGQDFLFDSMWTINDDDNNVYFTRKVRSENGVDDLKLSIDKKKFDPKVRRRGINMVDYVHYGSDGQPKNIIRIYGNIVGSEIIQIKDNVSIVTRIDSTDSPNNYSIHTARYDGEKLVKDFSHGSETKLAEYNIIFKENLAEMFGTMISDVIRRGTHIFSDETYFESKDVSKLH